MKNVKHLSSILVFVLLIGIAVSLSSCSLFGEKDDGEFTPVLRFAITSDIHVRASSNDFGSREKLDRFLGSAYEYARSEEYSALDGIFIVGDLVQDGKTAEYAEATFVMNAIVDEENTLLRVVMGNHEMHAYGSGDARFTPENIAKSTERFKSKLGYESEDSHHVINGYHFITLANDSYESRNYFNDEAIAWLKGEIEAAMADDPSSDKPIFVMQHEPPEGDVRGFTSGDTKLGELLKSYPRVIDFSGHTHRSILDPQSIWQDGFTAIGTGGLAYLGYNMAGHPTLDNSSVIAIDDEGGWVGGASNGVRTGAMYYIVEVDAKNNVRLNIYDLLTESFYGEPITFRVGADEEKVFTPDRAERSAAPTFSQDVEIAVLSTNFNYPQISFPTPTGGDLPQYYRIELWGEGDEPESVFYRLAGMHNAVDMPDTAVTPVFGCKEGGEYTIRIYAVNCWGKDSLPLTGSITIDAGSLGADVLSTVFNTDGTATTGEDGLTAVGNVSVAYDEELGKNIASFDGSSGYKFEGVKDYYDRMVYSFSLEAYFKSGEGIEESVAIGANMNSAGFGLIRTAEGAIRFAIGFNNGGGKRYAYVNTADGVAAEGEWVHAVATFDGRYVRLYVNGEQVTLYDNDGAEIGTALNCSGRWFDAPTGAAASFVVGGDIGSSGVIENCFIGEIAEMNIYSRAIDAEDVGEIYNALR